MATKSNPTPGDTDDYSPPNFDDLNWGDEDGEGDVSDDVALDLSGAKERAFEPLAPGLYKANLDEATYGRSQRSNNPMVTYKFQLDLPFDEASGKKPKRTVFLPVPITEDFTGRHKKIALSLDPEYDLSNWRPARLTQQLGGKPCRLRLKIDRYENRRNNKVTEVLPPENEGAGAFLS